jgi:two-component system, OmpR family, sensor histidine kinase ChvG
VSIRFKLLLLCLTTLVLPWAGCQYAGELETVLRASQEQALLASAGTIANALSAQPQRLFRGSQTASAFDPAKGDIYAFPLRSQPALDGYYRDDWGIGQEPKPLPTKDGLQARLQAGVTDRYLFLYLEVDDPKFDAEPPDPNPQANNFDRIDLGVEHPDGNLEVYFFSTQAPGLIAARTAWRDAAGYEHVDFEPRIQAYCKPRAATIWRRACL